MAVNISTGTYSDRVVNSLQNEGAVCRVDDFGEEAVRHLSSIRIEAPTTVSTDSEIGGLLGNRSVSQASPAPAISPVSGCR